MKYSEALRVIKDGLCPGFMVSFEWKRGGILCSDHFPDKHAGEKLIETEREAWDLARKFAAQTVGKCINIYVIKGSDFTPVEGYRTHMIENRQPVVSHRQKRVISTLYFRKEKWEL